MSHKYAAKYYIYLCFKTPLLNDTITKFFFFLKFNRFSTDLSRILNPLIGSFLAIYALNILINKSSIKY